MEKESKVDGIPAAFSLQVLCKLGWLLLFYNFGLNSKGKQIFYSIVEKLVY